MVGLARGVEEVKAEVASRHLICEFLFLGIQEVKRDYVFLDLNSYSKQTLSAKLVLCSQVHSSAPKPVELFPLFLLPDHFREQNPLEVIAETFCT